MQQVNKGYSSSPRVDDVKLVLVRPKGVPAFKGDLTVSRQGRPFNSRDAKFYLGLEHPDQFLFNYTFKDVDGYTGDLYATSNTFVSASIMEDHILAVDARWARGMYNAFENVVGRGLSVPFRTVFRPLKKFWNSRPISRPMKLAADMIYKKSQGFGKSCGRYSAVRYEVRSLVTDLFRPTADFLRPNNISLERTAQSALGLTARAW